MNYKPSEETKEKIRASVVLAHKEGRLGKKTGRYMKEKHNKVCPNCKVQFKSYVAIFCSKECALKGKEHKCGKVTINCSYCNKAILRYKSRLSYYSKHYCNITCMAMNYKQLLKGEVNPNFDNRWSIEQRNNLADKKRIYLIDDKVIKDLYYLGWTDLEIAKHLGCSREIIRRKRINLNLQTSYHTNILTQKQKDNLGIYGIKNIKHIDCIRVRSGGHKHELAKAVMCSILAKDGFHFITEAETINGVIDVYDLTNKIIYEMETSFSPKKSRLKFELLFNKEIMTDFFIFNLKEMPNDSIGILNSICLKIGLDPKRYL